MMVVVFLNKDLELQQNCCFLGIHLLPPKLFRNEGRATKSPKLKSVELGGMETNAKGSFSERGKHD